MAKIGPSEADLAKQAAVKMGNPGPYNKNLPPGQYFPGGPKPGAPPRQQMPGFHPQDKAALKGLQKRYAKQGDVTVAEGPQGYQFSLPSGKRMDTPSTFQRTSKGRIQ